MSCLSRSYFRSAPGKTSVALLTSYLQEMLAGTVLTLGIALSLLLSGCAKQEKPLFKIVENGLVGYIDEKGSVVIPANYKDGGEFSEGLAPVRLAGRYGYVNAKAEFVIQPQYAYAGSFQNGVASVLVDGKTLYIDKNGKQILDTVYHSIQFISPTLAVVETVTGVKGLLRIRDQKLLADTIYERIGMFSDGAARVFFAGKKKYSLHAAIIDSNGKYIVAPSETRQIEDYENGFFLARERKDTASYYESFFDSKGQTIFKRISTSENFIKNGFQNGLAVLHTNRFSQDVPFLDSSFEMYMNLEGEIVYLDSSNSSLTAFSDGRAFARDRQGKYRIINPQFKQVGNETFSGIYQPGFVGGYAVVQKDFKWTVVDTNGKQLLEKDFGDIAGNGLQKGFFFYSEYKNEQPFYGFVDLKARVCSPPVLQDFDPEGFKNGILKTVFNNRLTYFNTDGKIVWQEKSDTSKAPKYLDIDYMNTGDYSAASEPDEEEVNFRGFYAGGNVPKIITEERSFPVGLSVVVDTSALSNSGAQHQRFKAYTVYVANRSGAPVKFDAQNSLLYMKAQAKVANGDWRDIEYWLNSWCGNSYHTLKLEKNQFWMLSTPVYTGETKVRLRLALEYVDPRDNDDSRDRKTITIYSNEYSGSVNPGQFWNKRQYVSSGLMDPYGNY